MCLNSLVSFERTASLTRLQKFQGVSSYYTNDAEYQTLFSSYNSFLNYAADDDTDDTQPIKT